MKRKMCIIMTIIFCLMLFIPVSAHAETYKLSETDLSIQVDDSSWYVFTRDNIENNPALDVLGFSYNEQKDFLYDNDVYLDAFLPNSDGGYTELMVQKATTDVELDLWDCNYFEVSEFTEGVAENRTEAGASVENYSVYENQYKFAKVNYSSGDLYTCEYITWINKDNYNFVFQSLSEFSESQYDEIKNIIDSIQFDVDTSETEAIDNTDTSETETTDDANASATQPTDDTDTSTNQTKTTSSFFNSKFFNNYILVTVIPVTIGAIIATILNKKKKNKNKNDQQSGVDDTKTE